jgi:hypothetical protein
MDGSKHGGAHNSIHGNAVDDRRINDSAIAARREQETSVTRAGGSARKDQWPGVPSGRSSYFQDEKRKATALSFRSLVVHRPMSVVVTVEGQSST